MSISFRSLANRVYSYLNKLPSHERFQNVTADIELPVSQTTAEQQPENRFEEISLSKCFLFFYI